MIVLDTNVLSELMRGSPHRAVMGWMATQATADCYITSITEAEILHGILRLPAGSRRRQIEAAAEAMFRESFASRILSFDSTAARAYAQIVIGRVRRGRPISQFDAQIAGICHASSSTLATRNRRDFEHCGIALINPWDDSASES